jgi:hypothetical protein
MSEVKHTPGEWLVDGTTVYALNEQGYNRFSALVQAGHVGPMERTTIEELEANARLFALSAELLEYVASSASAGCAEARGLIARYIGVQQ